MAATIVAVAEGINLLVTLAQTAVQANAEVARILPIIQKAQAEGRQMFSTEEWASINANSAAIQATVDADIAAAKAALDQAIAAP